jgi:hypothetical protein
MMQERHWRTAVKAAWRGEIERGESDVIGTLNFVDGHAISTFKARKIMQAFWRSVDKVLFGHAAKRGVGVERWCFLEFGRTGTNLHMQFAAHAPVDPELFCCIINIMWSSFRHETAAMQHNHITKIIDRRFADGYNVKETRHLRDEDVGLLCSHRNPAGITYGTFNNQAQNTRICNRLTLAKLDQAQQAYAAHMAQAQAKIDRLHKDMLS